MSFRLESVLGGWPWRDELMVLIALSRFFQIELSFDIVSMFTGVLSKGTHFLQMMS
jgi:hypothetical protein